MQGKRMRRLILAAMMLSPAVYAQTPIVIKFSHVVAADTPKGMAAERFKQLAEKATRGKVRVDIYPDSKLYKDREELEALQLGAVQMLAPSLAKFGPLGIKEFEAFDIPFLFPDKQSLHAVTEGRTGRSLLRKLEPKGIIGLAYWDNGFKVISANRQIKTPADLRGLKFRIQASKVLDAQTRALGASPQVTNFAEVYQALKTGAADATENPPSNLLTQRMFEVQKHITVTNHGYLGYAVIVNKKFWESLPADIRFELEAAMKAATRYANDIAQQENDQALDTLKAMPGLQVYYPGKSERAEWQRALMPVQREMELRVGSDLLRDINRETLKAREDKGVK